MPEHTMVIQLDITPESRKVCGALAHMVFTEIRKHFPDKDDEDHNKALMVAALIISCYADVNGCEVGFVTKVVATIAKQFHGEVLASRRGQKVEAQA